MAGLPPNLENDRAAIMSVLAFIEREVRPRRCDSEAVSACVRCNAVAMASWLAAVLAPQPEK